MSGTVSTNRSPAANDAAVADGADSKGWPTVNVVYDPPWPNGNRTGRCRLWYQRYPTNTP